MYLQPTPEEVASFYNMGYWGEYQEHIGLVGRETRWGRDLGVAGIRWTRMREVCSFLKRGRVVDLGCGTGAMVLVASDMASHAVGVELDLEVAQAVQEKIGSAGKIVAENINHGFSQVTAALEGNPADVVFANDVLEHCPDPDRTLSQIRQMLSPSNGVLVVETPCRTSRQATMQGTDWKHLKWEHLWYFHDHELVYLVERNGFHVIKVEHPIEGRMAVYAERR